MPEIASPLAGHYAVGRHPAGSEPALTIAEVVGWDLLQLAAWRGCFDALRAAAERASGATVPATPSRWQDTDGLELLTVAPLRLWCIAAIGDRRLADLAAAVAADAGCVTPLGHSHVRVRLQGAAVRRLLAQELALDLAAPAFPAGALARTQFHHVPVTLQCVDAGEPLAVFDLYLPRTFAASTWAYLLDLAAGHGREILPPVRLGD